MTTGERQILLESLPGIGVTLARAVTTRKKKQRQPQSLPLSIVVSSVRVDARKLAKYREVCGFSEVPGLPLTYPHVMAFGLHLQLMAQPEFPFSPVGAVHVRNRIRQRREIGVDEAMEITVRLGDTVRVAKGHEVSYVTEVRIDGEVVWDDLSVMLVLGGGTGAKQGKSTRQAIPYPDSVRWQLAANKSREYALVSGDLNPIHLYPLTAKAMGYKRHIMHGMWSKGRTIAHLLPEQNPWPVSVEVAFKLPIFLPATVTLMSESEAGGSRFELRDGQGEKPHLVGELRMGEANVAL